MLLIRLLISLSIVTKISYKSAYFKYKTLSKQPFVYFRWRFGSMNMIYKGRDTLHMTIIDNE